MFDVCVCAYLTSDLLRVRGIRVFVHVRGIRVFVHVFARVGGINVFVRVRGLRVRRPRVYIVIRLRYSLSALQADSVRYGQTSHKTLVSNHI